MTKSRKSSYKKTNNRKTNNRKINKNSQKLRRKKTNKRRINRNRRTMKGGTASDLERRVHAGPYRLSLNHENRIRALKTFGQSYEKKTRGLHKKTKLLPRSPLGTSSEFPGLTLHNLINIQSSNNESSYNDTETKTEVSSISLEEARNRLTGNPRHKRGKKRQSIISRLRFPRPRLSRGKSKYKVQINPLIKFKENNNETKQNNWGAVSV